MSFATLVETDLVVVELRKRYRCRVRQVSQAAGEDLPTAIQVAGMDGG